MIRTLLISGIVIALLAGALALIGEPSRWPPPEHPPQQGEAADVATGGHSHPVLGRLVREPQNAWSNLAFVFGGAWLASTCATRLARCVGVVLMAVGVGSFLYHASASELLRQVDVGAMYWLFLLIAPFCAAAVFPKSSARIESYAAVLFVATLLLAFTVTSARNVVVLGVKPFSLKIATVLAAATIILSLAQVARRIETLSAALQLLGIVTVFGVAALCQTSDRPGGSWYRPASPVQAHAVWHVLAAATFVWSARFLDRAIAFRGQAQPA